VQSPSSEGKLEVVIATTAFGRDRQGDVRTVLHTALPETIRGLLSGDRRAGGMASVACRASVSFVTSRRTNSSRARTIRARGSRTRRKGHPEGGARGDVAARAGLEASVFEKALEKSSPFFLWVPRRRVSLNRMTRFVTAPPMGARPTIGKRAQSVNSFQDAPLHGNVGVPGWIQLVRHFGDQNDRAPCGSCDVCAAAEASRRLSAPSAERRVPQLRAS